MKKFLSKIFIAVVLVSSSYTYANTTEISLEERKQIADALKDYEQAANQSNADSNKVFHFTCNIFGKDVILSDDEMLIKVSGRLSYYSTTTEAEVNNQSAYVMLKKQGNSWHIDRWHVIKPTPEKISFFIWLLIILLILLFVFWFWMLFDCLASNTPTNHKLLWVIILLFLPILSLFLYYFFVIKKRKCDLNTFSQVP